MNNSGRAVDAETLQNRLPDGWTVETFWKDDGAGDGTGGEMVCGYTDRDESGSREKADRRGAVFKIREDANLWTAVWLGRRGPSADRTAIHRVTGVRERCIEWVVGWVRRTEETDNG